MAVAIILLNILIIATFTNIRGGGEVMNVYLVSLALADLLYGVLVVPFSVYPALVQNWVYGDIACSLIGYIEVSLWAVSAYTLMWISVDRYIAVRKPVRYFTVQTRTRCQCWMAFTWISSAMLCCPPLLDFDNKAHYDPETAVCMLNWQIMTAYSVTLSILILGPSLITILYTYIYIYGAIRRLRRGFLAHDKEYVTALSENLSNPTHVTSFVLIVTFWVCWTPMMSIKAYQQLGNSPPVPAQVCFYALWLGISNSIWKAFVLIFLSPQFRVMLRLLCLTVSCRRKNRAEHELLQHAMEDHFL
ncbi:beta-1 adrenergic receptor [Daktulosphaira vitifoliae]|uniref:beta-1 adrenergic receptor n=1 Tax=Daktulosphaira vitifoliae TaxID=58002 RepID=UPI0021A99172|nr:beta-1 adrenergic receptor [Daktulosphaira vitifoliae]